MRDYRGATVDDLERPPAVTIPLSMRLGDALEMSFETDYTHLPVLDENRHLKGYLTADQLRNADKQLAMDPVSKHYLRFLSKGRFVPITPDTALEDLETFFSNGNEFAIVTDVHRKYVLAVATPQDLEQYVKARPELA